MKRYLNTAWSALIFSTIATTVIAGMDPDVWTVLEERKPRSYQDFAYYNCIRCHHGASKVNLVEVFANMNGKQMATYLEQMLRNGNMPPDPVYRSILLFQLDALNQEKGISERSEGNPGQHQPAE